MVDTINRKDGDEMKIEKLMRAHVIESLQKQYTQAISFGWFFLADKIEERIKDLQV